MHNVALRSPLLEVQDTGLDAKVGNLNPFWAVLKHANRLAVPNMELVWDTITLPDLEVPDRKGTGLQAIVSVPRLCNTCEIKEGDVLTLPRKDDEDF